MKLFIDTANVAEIREPYITMNLILPAESVGAMMKLCEDRRGTYVKTEYIGAARVILVYEIDQEALQADRDTTISAGDKEGEFQTETRYTMARGGETVRRQGKALVYTGFQWRGRSFAGQSDKEGLREVMPVERAESIIGACATAQKIYGALVDARIVVTRGLAFVSQGRMQELDREAMRGILDFIQAHQQQVETGLRNWREPLKALLML